MDQARAGRGLDRPGLMSSAGMVALVTAVSTIIAGVLAFWGGSLATQQQLREQREASDRAKRSEVYLAFHEAAVAYSDALATFNCFRAAYIAAAGSERDKAQWLSDEQARIQNPEVKRRFDAAYAHLRIFGSGKAVTAAKTVESSLPPSPYTSACRRDVSGDVTLSAERLAFEELDRAIDEFERVMCMELVAAPRSQCY